MLTILKLHVKQTESLTSSSLTQTFQQEHHKDNKTDSSISCPPTTASTQFVVLWNSLPPVHLEEIPEFYS